MQEQELPQRQEMEYNLALSRQTETAISVAYEWYEQQKKGLGEEFLVAIDTAFLSIQSNPLLYGFRKKNIRGCNMRRFPYMIFFSVKRKNIQVISFLHTSRKPQV
jgi:toxin ParE1/3/4